MRYSKNHSINCPLCGKKIKQNEDMYLWECDQLVDFEYGRSLPHYRLDEEIGQELMVVYPYKINSTIRHNKKTSRILVYHKPKDPTNPLSRRFKGLASVPRIHPDTSDKLLERIKKLLIFL